MRFLGDMMGQEWDVVWSGALEMEALKEERATGGVRLTLGPPPPKRRGEWERTVSAREQVEMTVGRLAEQCHGGVSQQAIVNATRLPRHVVNETVQVLRQHGRLRSIFPRRNAYAASVEPQRYTPVGPVPLTDSKATRKAKRRSRLSKARCSG